MNSLEPGIGLDVGRLREHVAAIREVAARLAPEGFTLLAGTEVDILPDGSLDYPDDVLAELDWVVASPHPRSARAPPAQPPGWSPPPRTRWST